MLWFSFSFFYSNLVLFVSQPKKTKERLVYLKMLFEACSLVHYAKGRKWLHRFVLASRKPFISLIVSIPDLGFFSTFPRGTLRFRTTLASSLFKRVLDILQALCLTLIWRPQSFSSSMILRDHTLALYAQIRRRKLQFSKLEAYWWCTSNFIRHYFRSLGWLVHSTTKMFQFVRGFF